MVQFTGVLCTVGDGVLLEPMTQQEEVVMTSRPVGQDGHCFLVVALQWPRKEFDWNGDVATRVDCVPQRLNFLRNIYPKG